MPDRGRDRSPARRHGPDDSTLSQLRADGHRCALPGAVNLAALWERAQAELEIVLEITERTVTDRPAELSRLVHEHQNMRDAGSPSTTSVPTFDRLALLPLIEPDVIKLDLRLVQDRPSAEQAAIVSAVAAERERTGAAVVAEGIETDAHLAVARALGANLGSGLSLGPAGTAAARRPVGHWHRPVTTRSGGTGRTPYEVVVGHRSVDRGDQKSAASR